MEKYIEKAKELGYEVELAFETADGLKAWSVKGWGMDTMYDDKNNENEWKWLTTPEAHEHRTNMFKHNDPEDEFTMTDEEIRESSIAASVSAGLIDEEEAKNMREATKAVVTQ